jgi:hypothetical protein
MVATDSMATIFEEDGEEQHFPIDKLFALGSHAFIVSGGMGISVDISKRFKHYVENRGLLGIEAITAAAGPLLSAQYSEAIKGKEQKATGQEQFDRIFFVVGGYSFQSRDNPYQLALWGGEVGEISVQRIQIGPCLSVPRTMSGEMRLFRLCQDNSSMEDLVGFAKEFLQKLAETNPHVGPPFRFGTVTETGFTEIR